jgi:hypothetical protein
MARNREDARGRGEEGKRVFATVGTTRFDQLVAALDSEVSRALHMLLCCYYAESGCPPSSDVDAANHIGSAGGTL